MGCETEYERGLRSKAWGQSLRGVADSVPVPDIISCAEKSICADLRSGKLPIVALCSVASEFKHAYKMLADSFGLRLYLDGTSERDILDHYSDKTNGLLKGISSQPYIEHFIEVARESLMNYCRSGNSYNLSADHATELVMREFLTQYIDRQLCAAYDIAVEARHHRRDEVMSRREEIKRALELDHVINQVLAGNLKIRASRRTKLGAKQFTKISLLGTNTRETAYASTF